MKEKEEEANICNGDDTNNNKDYPCFKNVQQIINPLTLIIYYLF